MTWTRADRRTFAQGLLWISPWLLGFLLFTAAPIVLSLYYSLTDFGLLDSPVFIGLRNYRELLGDPMFRIAIVNTLIYAVASAAGSTLISLLIAALLDRGLRGTSLIRALIFLPTLVPVVSAATCWMWLFNGKFGLINGALGSLGVEGPNWLGDTSTAMPALVIMSFWAIGSPLLVCSAALRDVPVSLYEAADLDGLTGLRCFIAVTLPMISPAILFNAIMAIIWSLQVFAPPLIMTKGGPENTTLVYSMYVYANAFTYGRMGYASALAWLQALITLALTIAVLAFGKRFVFYRAGLTRSETSLMSTSRTNPALTRTVLTTVMWLIGLAYLIPLIWMAAVSLKTPAGSAAPGVGLLPAFNRDGAELSKTDPAYWSALGNQASSNYDNVWDNPIADFPLYLHNSLWIATLSVLGMVISSAIVAYGFARIRWRGREGVFLAVLGTLMIPQAVVMAPLYIVFKNLGWIGSFKPLWIPSWLGSAFSIFLLRQFFLTIPRELDEAARIDGCSHFGIFTRIILPLSKPALAAVAVLHFAAVWNDFLGPLLFLNHQDQYTLAIGLHMFQSQHGGTPWNLVMAFSLMVVAPVLVVYAVGRRFFVEGVGTQGLKE